VVLFPKYRENGWEAAVSALSMNWLSKHYTSIDCRKNEVIFRPPEGTKFRVGEA